MKIIITAVLFLLLIPITAKSEQVKIYLDDSRKDYVMAEKMDCRVHKTKNGVSIGFKAGNFLFSFGPEISLGGEAKVQWEKTVQALAVRYEELCARFNTGIMSKAEYEKRLAEVDGIAQEAFDFQENALKRVRTAARDAFKDLDKETGREAGKGDVEKKIDGIAEKVERLSSLDKTAAGDEIGRK